MSEMGEKIVYNVGLNEHIMDKVIREALEVVDDEAKKHFEEFGYRLEKVRNVFNNLQLLSQMQISLGSTSANQRDKLYNSLRQEFEFEITHLLISKVANSLIVFSEDGLGE